MGKCFSVTIRADCAVCGGDLKKRQRTFCSKQCRNKVNNRKYKHQHNGWASKRRAKYDLGKIQCKICGGWYVQVVSHTVSKHQMGAEEYKKEFDLPISRGVIPRWYKYKKGRIAMENGTYRNLESGAHKRYVKGDKKAIKVSGWKGRTGNIGFTEY